MRQIRQLVARFHGNAVAEVAAIHMLRGVVQLRHGGGHGAGHARADDQRDQFDDGEENPDADQDVGHALHEFSQRGEQMAVQDRGPGANSHERASFRFPLSQSVTESGVPRWNLAIEFVAGPGQRTHGESGLQYLLVGLDGRALLVFAEGDSVLIFLRAD